VVVCIRSDLGVHVNAPGSAWVHGFIWYRFHLICRIYDTGWAGWIAAR